MLVFGRNPLRLTALVAGSASLLFALGLYLQVPLARQLWLWPAAPPLGLAFAGSWLAGGAAAVLWAGYTGHLYALRPLQLTMLVAFAGAALHLYTRHTLPGNERYLPFTAIFATVAVLAAVAFMMTRDTRARKVIREATLHFSIRWAFLLFASILLPVGIAMVFQMPGIFPVAISPDMTAVYGWFFLGSFAYYFSGFLRPDLHQSRAQMLSFVVYDVLLLPPFLVYWHTVPSEYVPSLAVYAAVLVGSALYCGYFLFAHPRTRITGTDHAEHGTGERPGSDARDVRARSV
jgi:hypothetical protein